MGANDFPRARSRSLPRLIVEPLNDRSSTHPASSARIFSIQLTSRDASDFFIVCLDREDDIVTATNPWGMTGTAFATDRE